MSIIRHAGQAPFRFRPVSSTLGLADAAMPSSHATRAEYYRIGLETGLLAQDEVRDWAMGVIEQMNDPPAEIIEASWSHTQQSLEDNLRSVSGERDRGQAGTWLLGLLRDKHLGAESDLTWCARKAMHIARAAELDEGIYYKFDELEDGIFLAKNDPCGDLEACRRLVKEALAKYPSPPLASEA